MQEALFPDGPDHIYTVSELTQNLKDTLESEYPHVAILGEISNFHAHGSGHLYFTLKDENAQIRAAMFRGANRHLKFAPENGLEVVVTGRISVYGPRGEYQIVAESMEPKGLGALQLAFEQLKNKLAEAGLFDEERKQTIPLLPKTVGLITSPTGAAVQDMIRILRRRHPLINILLYPVRVQGEGAAEEIAEAIAAMNEWGEADVLLVGRGGGSLEDLWAFNTEGVAQAIAASKVPVVSAVGHETDFTISDFVADLRAPTPSAAAELSVPVLSELEATVAERLAQIHRSTLRILEEKRQELKYQRSHLKDPGKKLEEWAQHLDLIEQQLFDKIQYLMDERRHRFGMATEKLGTLSPLNTLKRGYSIVQSEKTGQVITQAGQVQPKDALQVRLSKGNLKVAVTEIKKK